ncbi:DNA-directed RNA polymerase subunit beta [Paenibacillus chungangensis]|uniref:DNA-directed RNA polymerase subunit beta n=1 Tax=Paenibacillus chungangensis TaxID=696535 RepID=A0ABW3HK67_9BACL
MTDDRVDAEKDVDTRNHQGVIAESEEDEDTDRRLPTWARVILWLLRKSIVPIIMVIMLALGLYVGYVYMGKMPEGDVFQWSTWKHMYDLVFTDS